MIVAGIHTGNWELLPITLSYLGHRIAQVYQPQPSAAAERVVARARHDAAAAVAVERNVVPSALFKLIPPARDAGLRLIAAIRAGWTAMIFVDDDPGGRCITPNLFGQPALTGNLGRVVRLARLINGLILPAYVERLDGARFTVRFLDPFDAATPEKAATRLNSVLAEPARKLADQWLMLPSYRHSD